MKKITILISLLAILAGYLWAQPLLAQAPVPRPIPDREAMDAGGPWTHRPQAGLLAQTLNLPMAPASAIAPWSKIVYQSYAGGWDVYRMNGDGSQPTRLTSAGSADITPRLNRGATRLVYASIEPGNYEIYVMNVNGSGRARLTKNTANDYNPAWSPDGMKIVFNSYRDGQSEVYVMNADGSGQTRLTFSPDYDGEAVWSPDGSKIAFVSIRDTGQQIYTMKPDGSNVTRITSANAPEFPSWSPDSLQLAFSADPDGDSWLELMVINADGTNVRSLADTGTTADLWARSWSPDGRFIANTLIGFINYQGNWYWTNAYLTGFDLTTNQLVQLGASDVAWHPDWQSTDLLPPTSSMTALLATSPSPIVVRWSGSDAGPSGILGYDVQVKDGESGMWTNWLTRSAATSGNYPGIGGHTYYFRARAWDQSSNAEAWPATAETSTMVEALPPISAVSPLPAYWRGDLTVSWGGSDPGGSGIATYDVQCQDGIGGAWVDWQMGISVTSGTFSGTAGHTYAFRTRAKDRAQNLGEWAADDNGVATTFFEREIAGLVYDTRHVPVYAASVQLTPVALNVVTSTEVGRYAAYLLGNDASYALATQHIGYGVAPTMSLIVTGNIQVDQYLPPINNLIQNGDFETDTALLGWSSVGASEPTTTLTAHTGNFGVLLRPNLEPHWRDPEAIGSGGNQPDLAVASDGTVHVTYVITGGIFYTRRDITGTWSIPELVATKQNIPALAVTSNGDVHIVWRDEGYIAYRRKAASGAWDAPISILWSGGSDLDIAAGSDGQVHVVLDGGSSSLYCSHTVYYVRRSMAGQWSPYESVGCASAPRIAVGPDNVPHVVVQNAWGQGSMAFCDFSAPYWGCSSVGNYGASGARIVVDAQNVIHLLWRNWAGGYHSVKLPGQWFVNDLVPGYSGNGDLAVDGTGNIFVVYTHGTDTYLQFKPDGQVWSEALPFSASTSGTPALGVDGFGVLHVAYNASSDVMHYQHTLPYPLYSTSRLSQVVSVPADIHQPTLSFLYRLDGVTSTNLNGFRVSIENTSEVTAPFSDTVNTSSWAHGWIDLTPWQGQLITVTFTATATHQFNHTQLDLDEITIGSWLTPDPQAVAPQQVEASASTVITITGDNFIAPVQVRLNDTPLPDATWVDTNTITTTVPVLPFGRYDVIVTNPGGQASGLAGALLVGYEVYLPLIHK